MTQTDDKSPQNEEQTIEQKPESELETINQELSQMKEVAQRAMADLQNYKRKAEEERSSLLQMGQVQVITDLMPVIDNFARALQHIPEELAANNWTQGILHIEKQLQQILSDIGITEIPAIGQTVDPTLHEVISTTEGEKDIIISEVEKGYTFKGKLIRPSKVIVGQ